MFRLRLTMLPALVIVLTFVVAAPTSAVAAVTRTTLVRSLLTTSDLGAGWQRSSDSGSGDTVVTGCDGTAGKGSVGVRHDVERGFQYQSLPFLVQESVQSFGTRTQARADFAKSVRELASCSTFDVDGLPWTITRLSAPDYADQEAIYRFNGSLDTGRGAVSATMVMAAARHGRQHVVVVTMVAGTLSPADSRDLRRSTLRLSRVATAKVAQVVGR